MADIPLSGTDPIQSATGTLSIFVCPAYAAIGRWHYAGAVEEIVPKSASLAVFLTFSLRQFLTIADYPISY
jgi:hypothetical protein